MQEAKTSVWRGLFVAEIFSNGIKASQRARFGMAVKAIVVVVLPMHKTFFNTLGFLSFLGCVLDFLGVAGS